MMRSLAVGSTLTPVIAITLKVAFVLRLPVVVSFVLVCECGPHGQGADRGGKRENDCNLADVMAGKRRTQC